MNEIFTVYVIAQFELDEEGQKKICAPEDKKWVDSYWTNEAEAIAEAERIWNADDEEFLEEVVVFSRALNISGGGTNLWKPYDRVVKRFR